MADKFRREWIKNVTENVDWICRLPRFALRHLPINWRIAIKRWRRHDLSPLERLKLMDIPIKEYRADSPPVLFWRGVPGRGSIHSEAMIALALQLRGIRTKFVICDGALSGCIQRTFEDEKPISEWSKRCPQCVQYGVRILEAFGISYVGMSEFVSPDRQEEFRKICNDMPADSLAAYEYCAVPVGQFAASSALRYLKGRLLKDHEAILREYLYSALVCSETAIGVLKNLKPSRVFMQRHIEYVAWAPAYVVLTKAGLPATVWAGSIAQDRRIVLRNVIGTDWSSIYSLTDKAWKRLKKQPLAKEEEEALDTILRNPYRTTTSIIDYSCNLEYSGIDHIPKEKLKQILNISEDKPAWCVFSHITWDAGFNQQVMAFENVFEWIVATVQAMLETKSVTWLLKIHPGESLGTIVGVEEFIKDKFPEAEQHIHFIAADSKITTPDLCSVLSGGITMHGTIGVQLPARGIPVITGERTHYTDKGFTYDGFTREQYLELVHQVANIPLLSEHQCNLARRYAYDLYFQRRIPINAAKGSKGYAPLNPKKLHLLFPLNDSVMDMICERIITGGEFILNDPLGIREV